VKSRGRVLQSDSLDLIEGHVVTASVVEFGRPGAFVLGNLLGTLDAAAAQQISGDTSRSKSMAANIERDSRHFSPPLDHLEHVNAAHRFLGESAALAVRTAPERAFLLFQDARRFQIGVDVFLGFVMHRQTVKLAALLMQRDLEAFPVLAVIARLESQIGGRREAHRPRRYPFPVIGLGIALVNLNNGISQLG
jgi:hypothetical protein